VCQWELQKNVRLLGVMTTRIRAAYRRAAGHPAAQRDDCRARASVPTESRLQADSTHSPRRRYGGAASNPRRPNGDVSSSVGSGPTVVGWGRRRSGGVPVRRRLLQRSAVAATISSSATSVGIAFPRCALTSLMKAPSRFAALGSFAEGFSLAMRL